MTSVTTSHLTPLEVDILEAERLSKRTLAYFQERLRNRLHELVLLEYMEQVESSGLKKSDISERLGKDPAQITRWLGSPGNWTLNTVSDLLLAMRCEPGLRVTKIVADTGITKPDEVPTISVPLSMPENVFYINARTTTEMRELPDSEAATGS